MTDGYFKPWRRRIGVLTLVVACVLAFAMAWSYFVTEEIAVFVGVREYRFLAVRGTIYWRVGDLPKLPRSSYLLCLPRRLIQPDGTDYGNASINGMLNHLHYKNAVVWRLPFWTLVAGPTLLSAWLLLSKPRTGKIESTELPPQTEP